METRHFRHVQAIADHGSFSAAARVLGVTQPMLTKLVARLEDELNAPLFERTSRGVKLTLYGHRVLLAWRAIARELDDLGSEIEALKAGIRGTVSLGAGQWWIDGVLPGVLAEMSAAYPDVSIRVVTGERNALIDQLRGGRFDFVLAAITGDEDVDLACDLLVEVVLMPTVRRGHALAQSERPVQPADLMDFPWSLPPRDDPAHIHLAAAFRSVDLPLPRCSLTATSYHLVTRLVAESDTVAFLPRFTHGSYARELVSLEGLWCEFHRKAGIVRLAERPLEPVARVVAAAIRALTLGNGRDAAASAQRGSERP
jgi:DNA-binding transcriptional LysR family regulator